MERHIATAKYVGIALALRHLINETLKKSVIVGELEQAGYKLDAQLQIDLILPSETEQRNIASNIFDANEEFLIGNPHAFAMFMENLKQKGGSDA